MDFSETKIIYHIDEEETPYLIKIPISPDIVTLGDFKNLLNLNKLQYKYFFKSMDDDFGVVKEEIIDDKTRLPSFNGRVISWLVSSDGTETTKIPDRVRGLGDSRPPSFHHIDKQSIITDDTESTSKVNDQSKHNIKYYTSSAQVIRKNFTQQQHMRNIDNFDTTSYGYSDDDTMSQFSSVTTATGTSKFPHTYKHPRRKRRNKAPGKLSRISSYTSITESNISLNVVTVILNMDTVNFLGISIVGQSNEGGDNGIYVGSIMKGGAVAQDGRIEPGDMILQVNEISFESMPNDDAVKVLREAVRKPGPIKLVVAKTWNLYPTQNNFNIQKTEPIRPIDPEAWVAHTTALRNEYPTLTSSASSKSTMSRIYCPLNKSTLSCNQTSNTPHTQCNEIFSDKDRFEHFTSNKYLENKNNTLLSNNQELIVQANPSPMIYDLNVNIHDMQTIVKAMATPDSGLDIRDRLWLKLTIPNAFLGSDVVDWLFSHVKGFVDKKEARKYAAQILKNGLIKHTVNKSSFSEQCYYVIGDLCGILTSSLSLNQNNSSDITYASEYDKDNTIDNTMAPLIVPSYQDHHHLHNTMKQGAPSKNNYTPSPNQCSTEDILQHTYMYPQHNYAPTNYGSEHSQNHHNNFLCQPECPNYFQPGQNELNQMPKFAGRNKSAASNSSGGSNRSSKNAAQQQHASNITNLTQNQYGNRENNKEGDKKLSSSDGTSSTGQKSMKKAMANPCEYFVDVM